MINPQQFVTMVTQLKTSQKYWIAYSGGLDSTALLHLAVQSFPKDQIAAIHINHGLSANASAWEKHCQTVCAHFNISLHINAVQAHPEAGESPEEAARTARYAAIAKYIGDNECLLTAHQQNDQAETVILQMLRGGGVRGLSAMPAIKSFAKGYLLRPLLNITRDELLLYAQQNQLNWIEDESNIEHKFDRNYLRHTILPVLSKRWPHINAVLAKLAQQCAEDQVLLNELAEHDIHLIKDPLLHDIHSIKDVSKSSLPISPLLKLSNARQSNVLRYWLRTEYGLSTTRKLLQQIQDTVLLSNPDAQPRINIAEFVITRFQDHIILFPKLSEHNVNQVIIWQDLTKPIKLPSGMGTITAVWEQHSASAILALPQNAQLTIKFRQGGERFHPHGRKGSHPLKKLFQEWKIPVWERDRIPLLYWGEELVAVTGIVVADKYVTKIGISGYKIIWDKSGILN